MYDGFERQRNCIDERQICDVRYEDLVKDPMGQMQRIYRELEMGDFENIRPAVSEYLEKQRDYRVNRHTLDPEIEQAIAVRWANYCKQYGYHQASISTVGSGSTDNSKEKA